MSIRGASMLLLLLLIRLNVASAWVEVLPGGQRMGFGLLGGETEKTGIKIRLDY